MLSVQKLKNKDELTIAFQWLEKHEDEIRLHLENIMPDYINRAYLAKNAIENILF